MKFLMISFAWNWAKEPDFSQFYMNMEVLSRKNLLILPTGLGISSLGPPGGESLPDFSCMFKA